ncbi:MAG: type II secretion system F family protein [Oscillospiraceae bacterium]|jgi:type IV pilus assembly protein PilC|nr:type II secretion system F family protein [Oscillospiraceae bacterium]
MKKGMRNEEVSGLCLELSLLLHAGVTLGDALTLLAEESQGERRGLLEAMAREVDGGNGLAAAMETAGGFPAYVRGLVAVGERSGRTEEALAALSRYYEERFRMSRRIRGALLYPAVMLGLMLVVIGVLLVKVLPIFDDVYASLGGRLTGLAGGLLSLGRWLDGIMPVLWGLLALAALLLLGFGLSEAFRERALALWRGRYGDRGISRMMTTAQVARALSMGMVSGLPLEESLSLAAKIVEEVPAASQRCLGCRTMLENGASLGRALRDSGLLPAAQCRLLELAQRGGSGDEAMSRIAEDLSQECDMALEEKVSRVEPALVLTCSVLVGLILLSVMLPLTHIMSAIG